MGIRAAALSRTGKFLAVAGWFSEPRPNLQVPLTGMARVYEVKTGALAATIRHPSSQVSKVCFSPDESLLLLRDFDSISLWKVATGEAVADFLEKSPGTPILAFAPDGKTFVTNNARYGITFWDTNTRKPVREDKITPDNLLKQVRNPIESVAFDPNGKHFTLGYKDGSVELWSCASGKMLCSEKAHDGPVSALAFSPDGTQLVSGGADTTLVVWSVK